MWCFLPPRRTTEMMTASRILFAYSTPIFSRSRIGWRQSRGTSARILRLGPDCPWALRRLKEDLRDMHGRRLFPDRHAHTVTFRLNREEFDLYKAVTAYINEFLPQASGRKKHSVALARTVLQRRLASSTMAIHESIRRRTEKQENLLKEIELLSPASWRGALHIFRAA